MPSHVAAATGVPVDKITSTVRSSRLALDEAKPARRVSRVTVSFIRDVLLLDRRCAEVHPGGDERVRRLRIIARIPAPGDAGEIERLAIGPDAPDAGESLPCQASFAPNLSPGEIYSLGPASEPSRNATAKLAK